MFKCYDSRSLHQQQEQPPLDGEAEALYGAHCTVTRLTGDYPAPPLDAPQGRASSFDLSLFGVNPSLVFHMHNSTRYHDDTALLK